MQNQTNNSTKTNNIQEEQGSLNSQNMLKVESMILQNERLLIQISIQAKLRKNRNAISPKMSLLVNQLQRNLIRISKIVPPQGLADPEHVLNQKQRFLKFYQKRNSGKKVVSSSQKPQKQGSLTSI